MDKSYILVVDQSTSGTKALIVDKTGTVIERSVIQHQQYYPQAGWVEHDAEEIYLNVKQVIRNVLLKANIQSSMLALLTITNQRETALVWDRITGQPINRAIVWQCQRTADVCLRYRNDGHEMLVKSRAGLMLDPYFSATKLQWILTHAPDATDKLREGSLLAGTIDSWLVWKLTGGTVHATDYTNASRTSLFNIHTLQWDVDLCRLFDVPMEILPEVRCSDELFGYTNDADLFDIQVPISGVIGDSQGALFGQMCFTEGMAKATYGTGSSVLMNIGDRALESRNGLVTTIAWGLSGRVTYAYEGVIRSTGDSLTWARDNLGLFRTYEEMEQLTGDLTNNEGVYLIPAFVGLGAPYWDAYARASIVGMNRGTDRGHMIRAALQSIAYQIVDVVQLMERESGVTLVELRADGGASDNSKLMQFQADMLNTNVIKSTISELSAMGSVFLGGLGIGFWASQEELISLQSTHVQAYHPEMSLEESNMYYEGWKKAVKSVLAQ